MNYDLYTLMYVHMYTYFGVVGFGVSLHCFSLQVLHSAGIRHGVQVSANNDDRTAWSSQLEGLEHHT